MKTFKIENRMDIKIFVLRRAMIMLIYHINKTDQSMICAPYLRIMFHKTKVKENAPEHIIDIHLSRQLDNKR